MIYFNGLINGILFGLGIFIAEVLVKALFHSNICG